MCRKLINKKTKGFSLVELMVVVAIMGVLASIAIPSYNSYRRSAKKNAYKTDLLSLHKGWLAFGVEQDSFCERDTNPQNASINNVGMQSLMNSNLYGASNRSATAASCATGTLTPSGCDGNIVGSCTGCTGGGAFTAAVAASSNGPGKHNFIGFGAETCGTSVSLGNVQIVGQEGSTNTTHDTDCDLGVTTYEMGVYGHISGQTYFGVSVNNNGVVSNETEITTGTDTANATCS